MNEGVCVGDKGRRRGEYSDRGNEWMRSGDWISNEENMGLGEGIEIWEEDELRLSCDDDWWIYLLDEFDNWEVVR